MEEEITEFSFAERSRIYTGHESNQMIRAIDELKQNIQRCIDSEQHWREVAHRSKEEVIREIRNEHDAENAELKDQLRFSVVTLSSEKELEAWNAFVEKHTPCRLTTKYAGGQIPYITQYGTGIGAVTKAHCQVCGAVEDISDYDVW